MTAARARWGRTPSRRRPTATGGTGLCSARSQAGVPACWATMWTLEPLQCTRWVCCWLLYYTQGTAHSCPATCCASKQASPLPLRLAAVPSLAAEPHKQATTPAARTHTGQLAHAACNPLWPASSMGAAQPRASAVERVACCCPPGTSKQPAHTPPATSSAPPHWGLICVLLCAIRHDLPFPQVACRAAQHAHAQLAISGPCQSFH